MQRLLIKVGTQGEPITLPKPMNSFDPIYKMIDCDMVEVLRIGGGWVLLIDEDGKGKGKPINEAATVYANRAGLMPGDCIVGDAVLCKWSDLK
jgi:hypothetical protein